MTNTSFGGVGVPVLSLDGSEVLFTADSNLPNSSGGFDLYLATLLAGTVSNLTAAPGYDGNASFTDKLVAFESQRDILGTNPDYNREIFLLDRSTQVVRQLTFTTFGLNAAPVLSADGSEVLFVTQTDPESGSQIPLSWATVGVETGAIELVRIHGQSLPNTTALIGPSGDFRYFFLASREDFVGDNGDHNGEIFELDRRWGTVRQLTRTTTGQSSAPSASLHGELVAFATTSPELPHAPGGTAALLRPSTGQVFAPPGLSGVRAVLAPDASAVVIDTTNELRLFHLGSYQSTTVLPHGPFAIIDASRPDRRGVHVAIRTREDPLGTNSDHNFELFTATCPSVETLPGVDPLKPAPAKTPSSP